MTLYLYPSLSLPVLMKYRQMSTIYRAIRRHFSYENISVLQGQDKVEILGKMS